MTSSHGITPGYVWAYRRVSSVQQSYARQTEALTKALRDAGVPEQEIESRIFEDKLTGKHENRPGYQALLSRVRRGDQIFVSSLDRFGRTTLHILNTIEELANRGVQIKSLKEGEQFDGITGKLILTILAALAEWERANIAERAAEGRAARAATGDRKPRAKTALTPETVAAVKAQRAQGMTIDHIVKTLGVSRASVYRALDDGAVKSPRPRKGVEQTPVDAETYLRQHSGELPNG